MVLVIILIRLAGSKPQRYSPDWDVLSRCPARLLLPQMGPLDCNSLRSFRCDGTAPHQLTPAGLNADFQGRRDTSRHRSPRCHSPYLSHFSQLVICTEVRR